MPDTHEPRVSQHEMRAALASRPRPQRPRVWDWDPDGSDIVAARLTDRITLLEQEIAELQAEGQRAAQRQAALQQALRELAGRAPFWRRTSERQALVSRGLL